MQYRKPPREIPFEESPGAVFSELLNMADTIHSGFARFPGTHREKHSQSAGNA